MLFLIGVSVVAGLIAGTLPALRAGRTDPSGMLKEGSHADGGLGIRTRRLLLMCEVALSLVLLMAAGVMLRSLAAVQRIDAGFDPRNVLTMQVALPRSRYQTARAELGILRHLAGAYPRAARRRGGRHDRFAAGDGWRLGAGRGARGEHRGAAPRSAHRRDPEISPGYLKAMRIPLLRGRDVDASDDEVVLVSRSAARLLWGDADPLGRRVTLPLQSKTALKRVVGIVGDVKQGELFDDTMPTVYEYTREREMRGLSIVVRSTVPPESLTKPIVAVFAHLDAQQAVENVQTMEAALQQTLGGYRSVTLLLGAFAVAALALASIGIYGVLSYIVHGRRRGIGIRTALGARTRDVLGLVVLEGVKPAGVGIVAGAVGALLASQLMSTLVFAISPANPLTLLATVGMLALAAVVASLVPAYRAARLDSLTAMRED